MSRATPQAAYETAREAMRRQDWPAVFACLDVSDLKKIAANAVALSLGASIDEAERTPDVSLRPQYGLKGRRPYVGTQHEGRRG